jgi:hypothetical protein
MPRAPTGHQGCFFVEPSVLDVAARQLELFAGCIGQLHRYAKARNGEEGLAVEIETVKDGRCLSRIHRHQASLLVALQFSDQPVHVCPRHAARNGPRFVIDFELEKRRHDLVKMVSAAHVNSQ